MFAFIWKNLLYYPALNFIVFLSSILWNNFGLAIIVIAVIFRLMLLPLMKRQNEMMRKMASLKPQLEALQKKYANNKEKLSQEQVKLYRNVGYNPLGCLGIYLPQLLILSVLASVIRNVSSGNLEGIYPFIKNWFANGGDIVLSPTFLFWDLTKSYSQISSDFGMFATISLMYLLLCILVGVSQYLMSKFTTIMNNPMQASQSKKKKKKGAGENQTLEEMTAKMTNLTMLFLPASTVFIAAGVPSALSIYWIVQSCMLLVQYAILDWDKTKKGVQNIRVIVKEKRNGNTR